MTDQPIIPAKISFIEFIPVSIFGSVMGLCGLSFAWHRAAVYWKLTQLPSEIIGYLAVASFITLILCYALKCVKFPELVVKEFRSPATICFFATIIVCLVLLPGVLLAGFPRIAVIMWWIGTVLMVIFAWYVLRRWIDNKQELANTLPAWVLPIVGTLDIPIIGDRLPIHEAHEISLMAFGIGSVFAVILLIFILFRLIFEAPLPDPVRPSLLILTAPLALAFTVYHELHPAFDIITGTLFYFNMFLLLLFGSKIIIIPISCPFKITWWAVSFPLSAVTISALTYAGFKADWVHQWFAGALLAVVTIVITYLFVQTIYKVLMGTF